MGNIVTGRKPVIMGLELGGNHEKAEVLASTKSVQVQIANLLKFEAVKIKLWTEEKGSMDSGHLDNQK